MFVFYVYYGSRAGLLPPFLALPTTGQLPRRVWVLARDTLLYIIYIYIYIYTHIYLFVYICMCIYIYIYTMDNLYSAGRAKRVTRACRLP